MNPELPIRLRIQLLGGFSVTIDSQPARSLEKPRQRSLLAYLAFHQGKPQSRSHLAFTFWPDSEEKQALTNLRNLLYGLRQALPEIDPFLEVDKLSITLRKDPACSVDLTSLQETLLSAKRATIDGRKDDARVHLEQASTLYGGDLVPNFHDEWIHTERDSLRLRIDEALAQLIELLRKEGDFSEAIRYSKIRIQIESLSERSHQSLMELLALSGDRAAALLAYQAYTKHLHAALDIEPGEEIQALYQKISQARPSTQIAEPKPTYPNNEFTLAPAPDTISKAPTHLPKTKTPAAHWVVWSSGLLALLLSILYFAKDDKSPALILEKSIAILPFENRSDTEDDRYFTDGFHDDLITRVSHIPEVKIISRTSVMSYRDPQKDLRTIAQELGVANIIEGSVQRSGDQIRINIQLIDAASGFHIWAKNYTKQMSAQNIFALQTEVTEAIAGELSPQLSPLSLNPSETIPTRNLAALEAYFRGKSAASAYTNESHEQAIDHYSRALELDPNFAQAHAALAIAYLSRIHYQGLPVEEQVAKAQPHVDRAMQLNPLLSEAHVARGFLEFTQFNTTAAITAFERATELNPNSDFAYQHLALAHMYHLGDPASALQLAQKAAELNPNNLSDPTLVPDILVALRRIDEAKSILDALLEKDPQNIKVLSSLGRLYHHGLYRFDLAIRYFREAFALDPASSNICSDIAYAYFNLGDTASFLEWSEQYLAIAPSSNRSTFLRGLAHEFNGETELAVATYSALKKSDDYFDWSAYKISAIAIQQGQPQHALERYLQSYPWVADPECPIDKKNFILVVEFAFLLHAAGQTERAQALAYRLKQIAPQMNRWGPTGYHAYDVPLYIALGDIPGAIGTLKEFIDGGGALAHVATDPYTGEIHDEPEFQHLIGIMNARLAAQKTTLRKMEANGELAPLPKLPTTQKF
ncbi:BTAD domain-containing putative transcriptional regulator [Pelagicoccus sp. SDUM812002]|uniref:BTAD domain-containing putative transcriptional regulator n=1 Tax=Pelagicoccus sp. SDUM812002 TaxID=3041266 RepID=UPI00280CF1B6|nr:BTAD domain-containing putative transcriptional regulator [Pelagicoccus sp. SDUM812002]MDQ8185705.1 BTAD domain-containing putative transcriptional regulator [Pelagicoccus sp. SDUM812002]